MPTYYNKGGIRIVIRIRENGHNIPHVHVIYAGENMSVSIITNEILAGDLSNKKAKNKAVEWIRNNSAFLLKEWRKCHV